MSQDEFRAPAGWYPDPLGHPQLRWWNSYGWTEQVSAAPEPLVIAPEQPRYAWKDDEPQVIPVQHQPVHTPAPPQPRVSTTLNELEAPRAQAKVDEPSNYESWQSAQAVPVSQVFPPAVAPAALPAAPAIPVAELFPAAPAAIPAPTAPVAAAPAPPAYWDADDYSSTPEPSVRPEDLKFWSGTSPAELRRMAREQAERENRQ